MNIDKLAMRTAIAVFALVLTGIAHAQAATRVTACDALTPTNALCITATAPTTYTDGTPITQSLSYRLEQKLGSGAFTAVGGSQGSPQFYVKNLAPGSYTFRMFATCATNCSESAASNAANGTAVAPIQTPNAPVIIIAATIRAGAPPLYRIVYTVKPRDGELVFVAPEVMRAVFASR